MTSTRRRWLAQAGAAACLPLASAWAVAQAPTPGTRARPVRVVQLLDPSADQQELGRDYSTGWRVAFAEAAKGGARLPELVSQSCEASPESVRAALKALSDDPSTLATVGTAGEKLSLSVIAESRVLGLEMAHVAPWIADSRYDDDARVLPLFASREVQLQRALQGLASVGIKELGIVHVESAGERARIDGVMNTAASLRLSARRITLPSGAEAADLAARLPANTPAVLLFLGGAIELAEFTRGLERGRVQRYVVCLADVDSSLLEGLPRGAKVPLIFAQVVPNPYSNSLEVVRRYRAALASLFDEAPSPVSLAGYLAGRYTVQLLSASAPDRAAVLATARRRPAADLGGFRFDFGRSPRGSQFVDQTLRRADGRLIG